MNHTKGSPRSPFSSRPEFAGFVRTSARMFFQTSTSGVKKPFVYIKTRHIKYLTVGPDMQIEPSPHIKMHDITVFCLCLKNAIMREL